MESEFGEFGQFGVIAVGILVLFAVMAVLYLVPIRLWVAALAARADVGIGQLIGMRLRRVPPEKIVNPRITAVKAGLDILVDQLEAHYLAGGSVDGVVNALISADKAGIPLDFRRASAIDLAGRNVLEAVHMSVQPKVIETPEISGVAGDGIQLLAQARITVRTNLDRLVGGAVEQTIIARVGEGVISTIGAAREYKDVLEHPDRISKNVLSKGLDAGTAFEILSIDIMDVNVGDNVGAVLQIKQAEANKQIAQALAEGRRAMAVAQEQEMKARVQEMQAKLVEAEAQVPLAMADAFRAGHLSVMADTKLRRSISETTPP